MDTPTTLGEKRKKDTDQYDTEIEQDVENKKIYNTVEPFHVYEDIFYPNTGINYTDDNTIIFSSVRMNPPTPGHLYLIDVLVSVASLLGVNKVYLILSKTKDCDNPITCDEKNTWLTKIIERRNYPVEVIIICVKDYQPSPFTPVGELIGKYTSSGIKNINLIMVAGNDRISMVQNIADAYYMKYPNVNSIDRVILQRDENMEYFKNSEPTKILFELRQMFEEGKQIPIGSISASLIRKIVSNDAEDIFTKIYENYLSPSDIEDFYKNIYESLKNCIPPKPKSTPKFKNKYIYPLIKSPALPQDIKDTNIGGKTMKRKTNKRITNKQKSIKRKSIKRKTKTFKKYNK